MQYNKLLIGLLISIIVLSAISPIAHVQAQDGLSAQEYEHLARITEAFALLDQQPSYAADYSVFMDQRLLNMQAEQVLQTTQLDQSIDALIRNQVGTSDFTQHLEQTIAVDAPGLGVSNTELMMDMIFVDGVLYARFPSVSDNYPIQLPADWVNLSENPGLVPGLDAFQLDTLTANTRFIYNDQTVRSIQQSGSDVINDFTSRRYGLRLDGLALYEQGAFDSALLFDASASGVDLDSFYRNFYGSMDITQGIWLREIDGMPLNIHTSIQLEYDMDPALTNGVPVHISLQMVTDVTFNDFGVSVAIAAPGGDALSGTDAVSNAEIVLRVENNTIIRPDNLTGYSDLRWHVSREGQPPTVLLAGLRSQLDLQQALGNDFAPGTYTIRLMASVNGQQQPISNSVTITVGDVATDLSGEELPVGPGPNLASTNEVEITSDGLTITRPQWLPAQYTVFTWEIYRDDQHILSRNAGDELELDLLRAMGTSLEAGSYTVWLAGHQAGNVQLISNPVTVNYNADQIAATAVRGCQAYQAMPLDQRGTVQGEVLVSSVVIMVHGMESGADAYQPWIDQLFNGAWSTELQNTCLITFEGGSYPFLQGSDNVGERSDAYGAPGAYHVLARAATIGIDPNGSIDLDAVADFLNIETSTGMGPTVWTGVEKLKQTVARVRYVFGYDVPITVVSHSQGTVITLAAVQEGMGIDNWILMGSPLSRSNVADGDGNVHLGEVAQYIPGYIINFHSKSLFGEIQNLRFEGEEIVSLLDGIGSSPGITGLHNYSSDNVFNLSATTSSGWDPSHSDWWGNPEWLLHLPDQNVILTVQHLLRGYIRGKLPTLHRLPAQTMQQFSQLAEAYGEANICDNSPVVFCTQSHVFGVSNARGWFGDGDFDRFDAVLYLTPGMVAGPYFDDKKKATYTVTCSEGQAAARLQTATWFDFEGAGSDWVATSAVNVPITDHHETSRSWEAAYLTNLDATFWLQVRNPGTTVNDMAVCHVVFEAQR